MASGPRRKWALVIANGLTLSRLVAGIFSVILFYSESFSFYLVLLFLYILISDLLDGFLARRLAVSTRAGGIFDYVVDRFNFYLIISILVSKNVPLLVFLPFFFRDLLYVFIQAYITIPSIRGTKAASFGGTIAGYSYVLVLNYWKIHDPILDTLLFLAFIVSLANLLLRIFRLRGRLLEELREDLFS
jgi:CDP-diacylglycerol--glycerol-3-phosphate 3-phosphatidyltransferase